MKDTLLIVDDSALDREILSILLQNDFTIIEACDGAAALELLKRFENKISIVLLDLMMPDIGGIELLRRRRELGYFKNVPTIVITSSNDIDDQLLAFNLGVNDYITKPFIPEIVVSRIFNVLGSSRRIASILTEKEEFKIKAELDLMTNLYNKTTVETKINNFLRENTGATHALLVLDIDNFKFANDVEGHLVGDHTIKIVADLISNQFRQNDIIGRIGGDEFVVFMSNVNDKDIVTRKTNEIVYLMKYKPNLTLPGNVSISIGYAFSDSNNDDYNSLFKRADEALYMAKYSGKARACEYGVDNTVTYDKRQSILLFSNNRDVCYGFANVAGANIQLIELNSLAELQNLTPAIRSNIKLLCVDISLGEGNIKWDIIAHESWLDGIPSLVVCQESDLTHIKDALAHNADDIITAPIDTYSLKRRLNKLFNP